MVFLNKEVKEDRIPLSNHFESDIPNVVVEPTRPPPNVKEAGEYVKINGGYAHQNLNAKMTNGPTRTSAKKTKLPYKIRQKIHPDEKRMMRRRIFIVLFLVGITLPISAAVCALAQYVNRLLEDYENSVAESRAVNADNYNSVSFTDARNKATTERHPNKDDMYIGYPKDMTDNMKNILKDNKRDEIADQFFAAMGKMNSRPRSYTPNEATVLYEHVFWGPQIENALPQGFGTSSAELWERFVNDSEIVKMEPGCGRMQNRLVTFTDGMQACVRYRQNTDQIQGEIFSYYLGKSLNISNMVPSVVRVVDVKEKLWAGVAADIAAAQWSANRAVVLTQYVPGLEPATIPDSFKPASRHLNKYDVLRLAIQENSTILKPDIILDTLNINLEDNPDMRNAGIDYFSHIDMKLSNETLLKFLELAQWADLIVFDYLTANLDRIVNNLFNYQWNANIMDGPAHNLAKTTDSGLLVFLDNESGLLHGYRLLNKYNSYHSLLLDKMCVFRKSTIDAIRVMYSLETLGAMDDMYQQNNDAVTKDVLPPLPNKNKKILYERLGHIVDHVKKCEIYFSR